MDLTYFLIFLASVLVGFINTLAGSGSLIMLPIFLELGLTANVANGTNRVGVLFQSIVGTRTFLKNSKINLKYAWWAIIPCIVGALFGAWFATKVSPAFLKQFIGWLLIIMLLVILARPKKWLRKVDESKDTSKSVGYMLLMFVIGFYGGFIQAGVGIFLLAGLVLGMKYKLSYANAIKLIIVAFYALPVLVIFTLQNQVNWSLGLYTAAGQSLGAYLGALFATKYKKADLWIYRLLILVIVGALIKFYRLWEYFL